MDIACPICYDHYNDKDKIPRILQCGHTFCQNCLMDLRTSNILTCPTCRKYFAPDVKQLIKNFTILGILSHSFNLICIYRLLVSAQRLSWIHRKQWRKFFRKILPQASSKENQVFLWKRPTKRVLSLHSEWAQGSSDCGQGRDVWWRL